MTGDRTGMKNTCRNKVIRGSALIPFVLLAACSGGGDGVGSEDARSFLGARIITAQTASQDLFDPSLEGSQATGRVGDIVMANSRVKLIIQAPGRDVGLGPHGGTIIDAGLAIEIGQEALETHDSADLRRNTGKVISDLEFRWPFDHLKRYWPWKQMEQTRDSYVK